ncbi:HalOD1 output domain-containing protein [Haloarcula sediminis]|uniref:HalOD1 output domain-containing protein n=1 Tax=Haloarcula sediminis TaxID=3111777 RepID=UPI002D7A08D4|nr:HalOD1 output domain-containing protein [Haloarcula sp. CK38]
MGPTSTQYTASEAVIETVARQVGVDPLELDTPLYDAIDPGELNALLDGADRAPLEVTFRYYGYTVTVDADLTVTLTE